MNAAIQYSFSILKKELKAHAVETHRAGFLLHFSFGNKNLVFELSDEKHEPQQSSHQLLPADYLVREPQKLAALILSQLGLNRRVFARQCQLQKLDKLTATDFLNTYHLMNATRSAYNLGLFYKDELLAVASFSKGRKMNRLPGDQRSFELIRFCCKSGVTVTGGLTKLVKNFAEEKQAGDIMTYIDKQWSNGKSFISAGFRLIDETAPSQFLINKTTFERRLYKQEDYNANAFYLTSNLGNFKLVYTPGE